MSLRVWCLDIATRKVKLESMDRGVGTARGILLQMSLVVRKLY